MSYLKPNSGGVYDVPSINVSNTLYIKGKSFNDAVNDLIGSGQLTQEEIDELKTISARIDVSGLTGSWVVTDANKNAALKTLLDSTVTTVSGNTSTISGHTTTLALHQTTLDNQAIALAAATSTAGGAAAGVAANTTTIAAHTTQLAAQDAAIAAANGNIATNTTAIAAAGVSISAAATAIAANTTAIANNTTNITNNTTSITANTSAISTAQTNINNNGNSIIAANQKNGRIDSWTYATGNIMTGIRDGTGFACALGNGESNQNGIFCYRNDSDQTAQIRIESQNQKQIYMRGGSAVLMYGGSDGTILARNLVRVGDTTDNVQIGSLASGLDFPLIHLGTDVGVGSVTHLRGRLYLSQPISIYDCVLRASGIVGPENGRISTTSSPAFSGLSVIDPAGSIGLTAVLGAVNVNAGVGAITLTALLGGISAQTTAGAITYQTGLGAISFSTGAGPVNIATGSGNMNFTTISSPIYIGAGKGALGTSGELQLRSKDKISISPDATTEIDKTAYIEMADNAAAPATTTRKLYHTSSELYYNGTKLSNQTSTHNVKEITAGSGITVTSASGNYTINANVPSTPALSAVLAAGNTAGSTALNMNSQDITNVATLGATTINATTLVPTNITGWNIKSLNAGTGISIATVAGSATITATATAGSDVISGDILGVAAVLPEKPSWYFQPASWVNKQASDTFQFFDNWVSSTGQFQIGVGDDKIRYSKDWGVTWGTHTLATNPFRGVCGTATGKRIFVAATRVWYHDTPYNLADFGVYDWNIMTSFPLVTNYSKIACSQDGKYILAGTYQNAAGYGSIYTSNNYGDTATLQNLTGVLGTSARDVGMSSDGKYQFVLLGTNEVKYSTTFGASWNTSSGASGFQNSIAVSATGQYVTTNTSSGFYISNNYGVSFVSNIGFGLAIDTQNICMSANGQYQMSCYGNTVIYSKNYGRNWSYPPIVVTSVSPAPYFMTISCSSTGGYVSVAGMSGRQYATYDTITDVRQLVAGTNVTLTNDGLGTYTIAASGGGSATAVVPAGYYTFNQSTWNTLGFDFQNYDYEATFEFQNLSSNTWLYFFWNNVDNASHSGTLIYAPSTGSGGTENISTNYGGNGDGNPYTIYSGNNDGSSANRSILVTYKFRGLSATYFTMNIVGKPNLHWPSFLTYIPQFSVSKGESTYYSNSNGVNWGPVSLKVASSGSSYTGKMTWRRINKTS